MNIKELRTSKGYTQEKIAEALGINQTAVAMWETGKALPTIDKVIQIGKTLNTCTEMVIRSFPKWREEHGVSSDWSCRGRCLNCSHSSILPQSTADVSYVADLLGNLEQHIKNGWDVDNCFVTYTFHDGKPVENNTIGRERYVEAIRTAIELLSKETKMFKEMMKEANITQSELATLLGVHQTLVSQWCN